MVIAGLQKLSLIDYPSKVCSVVFTQGCLFRCAYCHNPELIPITAAGMPEATVFNHLKERQKFLDGVCITGGEPTLHRDLPAFIRKIKALGLLVKLDTNGSNPLMVESLINERSVDYLAMDLKYTWKKYDEIANTKNKTVIENCRQTFGLIQFSGVDHEFRTTILPGVHREQDFFEMAGYLKPGEKYFIQQTQFVKNFDPAMSREIGFDVKELAKKLREAFPQLLVEAR